jgi:hypothetical protein
VDREAPTAIEPRLFAVVFRVRMAEIVASISRFRSSRTAPRLGRVFFSASISAIVVERMIDSKSEHMNDVPTVRMMTNGRTYLGIRGD